MPILTRAVLKEVLRWYAVGVALFLILQSVDLISGTVDRLLLYKPPIGRALAALGSRMPTILNQTLVLSVAFAILLAFSRMQQDSELKAISASGVRPLRLVWPLALPFALVAALAFVNADRWVPAGLANWDRAWYAVYQITPPPPAQENYTYAPPGALYYAGRVINDQRSPVAQLQGVMVQRGNETVTASGGFWDTKKKTWTLNGAWVVRPGQNPVQLQKPFVVSQGDTLRPPPPQGKQATTAELRSALASGTVSGRQERDYRYQLAARYADPLTAVVFALAAGVLGLLVRNRAAAFAAVVVFIVAFYVVYSTVPQLAASGAMHPTLAAWLPNGLFAVFTAGLAWRLR